MTFVVGVSCFYHDSAVALIHDGKIVSAVQEERFTRVKGDSGFPENGLKYVLDQAGITLAEVDFVAFYDKPFLKFERLLETYVAFAPRGLLSFLKAMPLWLREKLFQKDMLFKKLKQFDENFNKPEKLLFCEHHISHAASAFFPSPFEEAVVLTLDGVGEWVTSSVCIGKNSTLTPVQEIHFPHSIGLLYSAFTYYLGFRVNSGEYKVMGLAPYGQPKYTETIKEHLIEIKPDGSFKLRMEYFNFAVGLTMTNDKFATLFDNPVRKPDSDPLTQFHMDMAASVQAITEEVLLKITLGLSKEYEIENLCLAGGVALNCVANGKILRDGSFKKLWVQPGAGDAGGAIGAALSAWHLELGAEREVRYPDSMQGAYLGPQYAQSEVEQTFKRLGAKFEILSDEKIIERTAAELANGKAVGWMQGRMEFGPRALGNRSILADPRSPNTQRTLNLKVKFRESFRPFAPSVLREKLNAWFDMDVDAPYMQLVAPVSEEHHVGTDEATTDLFGIDKLNLIRSSIPAVTHVDYSARIQTVHPETNKKYHALINEFEELTGVPILVNTSFNVRGEPIVCSPEDAFNCFMGTELDVLVCENCFLVKQEQPKTLVRRKLEAIAQD